VGGLFTRWFHGKALTAGWIVGTVTGTAMAAAQHFQSSIYPLHLGGLTIPGYAALYSVVLNIAVVVAGSVLLDLFGAARGADETRPEDYVMEPAAAGAEEVGAPEAADVL
jgi:solute:Na+ symporter, SSS family